MRIQEHLREEDGFTIQELLVVLLVSSLLVGYCLSTFLFAFRLFSSWQKGIEMRRTVSAAAQVMILEVERSDVAELKSDSSFVVKREVGRNVSYALGGDTLSRDGSPFYSRPGLHLLATGEPLRPTAATSQKMRPYLIKLSGTWGDHRFESSSEVSPPASSFAQFYAASDSSVK
jgi:competence protein ComGC